jgi:hypothetical protein
MSPSLLSGLAGNAEPGRDLSPRVPGPAEPCDGAADQLVQLHGEPGHVGQGVNVIDGHRLDRPGKSGGRYVCELPLILPDSGAL